MRESRKKILFLIMGPHVPSSKFRVRIYLPLIEKMGWRYDILDKGTTLVGKWKILTMASHFQLIFIQKRLYSGFFLRLLRWRNPHILFDFDDALFAKEPTGKPFRLRKPGTRYTKHRLHRVLKKADWVIAGNNFLADYAKPFAPHVVVIPTAVNLSDYPPPKKRKNGVVIGWIGTGRNLVYFQVIRNAIKTVAVQFPQVEWRIISDRTYPMDGVVIRHIPWKEATALMEMSQFDIGLMPLFDDDWSRGKCGFKILQYMAASIPTVASPVGVNTALIQDGVTGYLAGSDTQWVEALTRLIENEPLRLAMGQNSRRFVEAHFSVDTCWEKLQTLLEY